MHAFPKTFWNLEFLKCDFKHFWGVIFERISDMTFYVLTNMPSHVTWVWIFITYTTPFLHEFRLPKRIVFVAELGRLPCLAYASAGKQVIVDMYVMWHILRLWHIYLFLSRLVKYLKFTDIISYFISCTSVEIILFLFCLESWSRSCCWVCWTNHEDKCHRNFKRYPLFSTIISSSREVGKTLIF
jgi:hypothetical protein